MTGSGCDLAFKWLSMACGWTGQEAARRRECVLRLLSPSGRVLQRCLLDKKGLGLRPGRLQVFRNGKSANPDNLLGARDHGPGSPLFLRNAAFLQKFFHLLGGLGVRGPEAVARSPVAQRQAGRQHPGAEKRPTVAAVTGDQLHVHGHADLIGDRTTRGRQGVLVVRRCRRDRGLEMQRISLAKQLPAAGEHELFFALRSFRNSKNVLHLREWEPEAVRLRRSPNNATLQGQWQLPQKAYRDGLLVQD